MTDQEAIEQLPYAAGISAEVRDHAIHTIETLAKARALLSAHTEHLLTVGRRRDHTQKLVNDLYDLLEAKP